MDTNNPVKPPKPCRGRECCEIADSDDNTSKPGVQQYGNICDPDFNNDGLVNGYDKMELREHIRNKRGNYCADYDLNGDGTIDRSDYSIFKQYWNGTPGPGIGD